MAVHVTKMALASTGGNISSELSNGRRLLLIPRNASSIRMLELYYEDEVVIRCSAEGDIQNMTRGYQVRMLIESIDAVIATAPRQDEKIRPEIEKFIPELKRIARAVRS
jgi:hypothetical protein